MKLGKVIFIDSVHSILWERLKKTGWTCEDFTQSEIDLILKRLNEYSGIVIRSRFQLTKEILSKLPHLKFIARAGSGLENIDVSYCYQNNIKIFSSPEGNKDAVGEHALGMLLMLKNHLKRADDQVRNGIWKRTENRGYELKGCVIHSGGRNGGHYVCVSKRRNKWYMFNDSSVSSIDRKELNSNLRNGYLFYYEKTQ